MTELEETVDRMKVGNHGCDYFEFGMVGNSQGRRS